jgi:CheY-like chemotaxis protein
VLLVEDDRDIREALAEVVEARGVGVTAACDGLEALAVLRGGDRPAAVFLDHCMPKLDGAGVLAAMRADPALSDIPVVWMSADPGQPPAVAEHLRKPFDMEALLEVLGSLCGPDAL